MEQRQVSTIMVRYFRALDDVGAIPEHVRDSSEKNHRERHLNYVMWLCKPDNFGQHTEANLYFVQGILWHEGFYKLADLRRHIEMAIAGPFTPCEG